ncbi:MAG: SCO1664 family protein [Dehalococcoidia bacterium]|nr:SCO1664 family protein [Dehalococcoidia bacterium]
MAVTSADGSLQHEWRASDSWVLDALRDAEICDQQLVYDSSNYVFLTELTHREHGRGLAVYKPARGERPLHDFPFGTLFNREVAAYELSRLLGWDLVPPTVGRGGPHGEGSMQLFIEHDPSEHYFVLRERDTYDEQFVRCAVFDLLANNADRKGGHVLLDEGGHIWGIDNGLCFHQHQKLRTVIWDYAGTEVPEPWLADIRRLLDCLDDDDSLPLRERLSRAETEALRRRARALLDQPVLPEMYPYRCVPWPMV